MGWAHGGRRTTTACGRCGEREKVGAGSTTIKDSITLCIKVNTSYGLKYGESFPIWVDKGLGQMSDVVGVFKIDVLCGEWRLK